MAEQLQFELVTPEKLLIDKTVEQVVVPGEEGDFGVLPDHAPVISTLRPGIVEIYESESGAGERVFLKGGFAEVNARGLVILADDCLDPREVDAGELDQQIRNTEEDLADAKDDRERAKAEAELAWMRPLREILAG